MNRTPQIWLSIATALILFILAPPLFAPKAATDQPASEGERLFQQRCTTCHTIGRGDLVGPDLKNVTNLRDPAWLQRWILEPDTMLAQHDPIATELLHRYNNVQMPNLGLTEAEVADLIAYLKASSQSAAPPSVAAAAPGAAARGDALSGEKLFTGVNRFQNGGPACMSCHSIAGMEPLGGGTLGPDLTGASQKYKNGLAGILANIPFPTMKPIFGRRLLTPQEQADLVAFLQSAPLTTRPAHDTLKLLGLAVGYAVLLFALAQGFWSGRLRGVRGALVQQGRNSVSGRSRRADLHGKER